MPHLCPRPCSRLATAAVYISVGVVQFIVGIILLRSKYIYLLAGPDFWTSSCNIAVGCLLGIAASVWKKSKKRRPSKKHFVRFYEVQLDLNTASVQRNLLLTLLFSALIMNVTTLGIFLLGEGNTLLSIRLENGKKYEEATFASEVLAYAYVASVCCPIVCIVVTIFSMSGSCFKYAAAKKSALETKTVVNTISNGRTEPLRWVYTPELYDPSKKKLHERALSSSSESLSDEDAKDVSTYHNYSSSAEDVHEVFSRMAQGKRDNMLTDSAVMLREMDLRRKNKYDYFDRDGSYVGPMLQRARESILGERRSEEQAVRHAKSPQVRVKKPLRDYPGFNRSSFPPDDVSTKRAKYIKSKAFSSLRRKPYGSQELVNEYQRASSKLVKHYPSQYKKFRQRFRSASDISDRGTRDFPGIHKKPRLSDVELELRDLSEYRDQRKWKSSGMIQEENGSKSSEEASDNCFSPDGSDFGGDLIFETSRRSSWAGEVVPISVKRVPGLKLSHKLIPVSNPVVPPLPRTYVAPRISDDSGIGSVASNTFSEVTNCNYKSKKSLASFQEDSAVRNEDDVQEHPKVGSQSIKKHDVKVVKMASISEEPNVEMNNRTEASPERYDLGDADLSSWKCYSGKKSPLSKNRDRINLRRDTTLKRKASASGKALRKMMSLAVSENKGDFRDQVVDEDSLIGLSEEQLIARQLRTRSIRKVVQQRMREKVGI